MLINCQVALVDYFNTVTLQNVLVYNQPAYVSGSTFVNGSASSVLMGCKPEHRQGHHVANHHDHPQPSPDRIH